MIACLDVCYSESTGLAADHAVAAGLAFHDWSDAAAAVEKVVAVHGVAPYQPGEFFRRELPCLLAVLKELPPADIVIVDGFVWLDGDGKHPGLGAHLHAALGGTTPVVGVAKRPFKGAAAACVLRGGSQNPLWITAAGMEAETAAQHVRAMHGPFRIPTLLKRVDALCRGREQVISTSPLPRQ